MILIAPSVANATADLLMLGAWSCAVELVQGTPIPVSIVHPNISAL